MISPNSAQLKIIFAGSVGAGKSSSIQAVSDVDLISTDELASDDVGLMKETTTVALDYGQINLPDGTKLHLYGTPGQKRFDFMWSILAQGSIGVVLLIDDAAANPVDDLKAYLDAFSAQIDNNSLVIGITRTDLEKGNELNVYREFVAQYDRSIPVFTVDARNRQQVKTLVRTMLYRIDPWLD